jgi:muramoyltetrapeptide carboxypeptidase
MRTFPGSGRAPRGGKAIKPPRLNAGDRVGIICPASAPPDPKAIDRGIAALEALGFATKLGKHARKRNGFLAGTDRDRTEDLMGMFSDQSVKAIICFRGGYGTARLLPLIDYSVIRRNPKIFIGYSDITSLHCAFWVKSRLVTFHGPMLNSDFIQDDMPDFTLKSFLRTLTESTPPGSICQGYAKNKTVKIVAGGTASGPLIGGNLSLLCATLGTPFQPSLRKAILFFEDLDETPYRLDRMLTHLLNANLLQEVAGVAIGINKDCHDPNAKKTKEYRQTSEDVFRERLSPLGVPVVTGLPFGHIPVNATLPFGLSATLDARRGDLILDEPAVN